ncbi:hypothetical protein MBLNU13_g02351t1 [Cladosporium sp. NU13]
MSPSAQSGNTSLPEVRAVSSDLPASAKALDIPELLQIVLGGVPVQYLTSLRRVARVWNDIVSEINHIGPTTIGHGDEGCRCLGMHACTHIPHYTGRFAVQGNPAFTYTYFYRTTIKDLNGEEITPTTLRHYRGLKFMPWDDVSSDLDASDGHFITDPPITLVALGNTGLGYTAVKAMLRVSTGIRVKDLRKVLTEMDCRDGGRVSPYDPGPSAWYACTSDIIRRTSETNNGESHCDDGDDFAARMLTLSLAT